MIPLKKDLRSIMSYILGQYRLRHPLSEMKVPAITKGAIDSLYSNTFFD
jgi:hypothetical protein